MRTVTFAEPSSCGHSRVRKTFGKCFLKIHKIFAQNIRQMFFEHSQNIRIKTFSERFPNIRKIFLQNIRQTFRERSKNIPKKCCLDIRKTLDFAALKHFVCSLNVMCSLLLENAGSIEPSIELDSPIHYKIIIHCVSKKSSHLSTVCNFVKS